MWYVILFAGGRVDPENARTRARACFAGDAVQNQKRSAGWPFGICKEIKRWSPPRTQHPYPVPQAVPHLNKTRLDYFHSEKERIIGETYSFIEKGQSDWQISEIQLQLAS